MHLSNIVIEIGANICFSFSEVSFSIFLIRLCETHFEIDKLKCNKDKTKYMYAKSFLFIQIILSLN